MMSLCDDSSEKATSAVQKQLHQHQQIPAGTETMFLTSRDDDENIDSHDHDPGQRDSVEANPDNYAKSTSGNNGPPDGRTSVSPQPPTMTDTLPNQQQQDRDSFETFASVPLSAYDEIRDAMPSMVTSNFNRHRLIMSKIRVTAADQYYRNNKEKNEAKNRWLKSNAVMRKMKNANKCKKRDSLAGDVSTRWKSEQRRSSQRLRLGRNNEDHQSEFHETLLGHNDDDDMRNSNVDEFDGFRIVHHSHATTSKDEQDLPEITGTGGTTNSCPNLDSCNTDDKDKDDFFANNNNFDRVELLESASGEEVSTVNNMSLPGRVDLPSDSQQQSESSSVLSDVASSNDHNDGDTNHDNDDKFTHDLIQSTTKPTSVSNERKIYVAGSFPISSLVVDTAGLNNVKTNNNLNNKPWSPPAIHSVKVEKTICNFQDRLKFYQSNSITDAIEEITNNRVIDDDQSAFDFEKKMVQQKSQKQKPSVVANSETNTSDRGRQNHHAQKASVDKELSVVVQENQKTNENVVETTSFDFATLRAKLQAKEPKTIPTTKSSKLTVEISGPVAGENKKDFTEFEFHQDNHHPGINQVEQSPSTKRNTPVSLDNLVGRRSSITKTNVLAKALGLDNEDNDTAKFTGLNESRQYIFEEENGDKNGGDCTVNDRKDGFSSFSDRARKFEKGENEVTQVCELPCTPKDENTELKMTRRGTLLSVKRPATKASLGRPSRDDIKPDIIAAEDDCDDDDDDFDDDDEAIASDRRQTLKSIRPLNQPKHAYQDEVKTSRELVHGLCVGDMEKPKAEFNDSVIQTRNLFEKENDDIVQASIHCENYASRKKFFEMLSQKKEKPLPDKVKALNILKAEKVNGTPLVSKEITDDALESLDAMQEESSHCRLEDDHPLYVTIQDDDVSSICQSISDFRPVVCKPSLTISNCMSRFQNSPAPDKETKYAPSTSVAKELELNSNFEADISQTFNSCTDNSSRPELKNNKDVTQNEESSQAVAGVHASRAKESWRIQRAQHEEHKSGYTTRKHPSGKFDSGKFRSNPKVIGKSKDEFYATQNSRHKTVSSAYKIEENAQLLSCSNECGSNEEEQQNASQNENMTPNEERPIHHASTSVLQRCTLFQKYEKSINSPLTKMPHQALVSKQCQNEKIPCTDRNSVLPYQDVTNKKWIQKHNRPSQSRKGLRKSSLSLQDILDSKKSSSENQDNSSPPEPTPKGGLSVNVDFSNAISCDSNIRPSELLKKRKCESPKNSLPSPLITRRGFSSMIRSPKGSAGGSKPYLRCF